MAEAAPPQWSRRSRGGSGERLEAGRCPLVAWLPFANFMERRQAGSVSFASTIFHTCRGAIVMVQMSELASAAASGERVLALRFDEGEEIVDTLLGVAAREGITAAGITGIGALSDVTLGYFDLDRRDYLENEVGDQVEVLCLVGNLAEFEGKPKLHAHIVVGKRDGTTMGGHLMQGHVRPTLELIVSEAPAHLKRRTDPKTGLALLDLEKSG